MGLISNQTSSKIGCKDLCITRPGCQWRLCTKVNHMWCQWKPLHSSDNIAFEILSQCLSVSTKNCLVACSCLFLIAFCLSSVRAWTQWPSSWTCWQHKIPKIYAGESEKAEQTSGSRIQPLLAVGTSAGTIYLVSPQTNYVRHITPSFRSAENYVWIHLSLASLKLWSRHCCLICSIENGNEWRNSILILWWLYDPSIITMCLVGFVAATEFLYLSACVDSRPEIAASQEKAKLTALS